MKLAFVLPWYGQNIPGGAEFATRRLAENLAAAGRPVEVLTTCIRDFHSDWGRNYHRAGARLENGVLVRRFRVTRRNALVFDDFNGRLLHGMPLTREEEFRFMREMVHSPDLTRYMRTHCDAYVFLLTPYLFSTSYYGVRACPDRAWLIPRLHDESYAHLQLVKETFEAARGVIFLSHPEMALARSLYNLDFARVGLVGDGIDMGLTGDAERFRARTRIADPFILYAGRRDATKNVPALIEYFQRYRMLRGKALKLVLIGSGDVPFAGGRDADVVDLGFVSPQEKADALAAAALLCQPSKKESFSLVIMEAWLADTPVLVHADCAVTVDHCRRSNGGLFFNDFAEFAACLDFYLSNPQLGCRMGRLGHQYVQANYSWDAVIRRFEHVLELEAD